MKKFLVIFICIFTFAFVLRANDDELREEISQQIIRLYQNKENDIARKLYLENEELLKDNGLYEMSMSFINGSWLYSEGRLNEALKEFENSTRILDENYSEVISSGVSNLIVPYYFHAHISNLSGKKNIKGLYEKAKKAFEESGFTSNEYYIDIIDNLSVLENEKEIDKLNVLLVEASKDVTNRNFPKAEPKIEKALSILNKMENPSIRMLGIVYQLKGRMAWFSGDINKAEESYLNGIRILEPYSNATEEIKELLIRIYVDLGTAYSAVNDYEGGYAVLKPIKEYYESQRNLGYDYARTLGNLAQASMGLNKRLESSMYYETAIDILINLENVNPDEIATLYSSLVVCYQEMGNYDEALATALKAKEFLADNSFASTKALAENNLACLYLKAGKYNEAQQSLEKAVSLIGKDNLGPMVRFNYVYSLYLNDNDQLIQKAKDYSTILQSDIVSNFIFLSESQRQNYWSQNGNLFLGYNRFLFDSSKHPGEIEGTIYNNALFTKGLLLRTSNWLTEKITRTSDSNDIEKLNQISQYQEILKITTPDSLGYYEGKIKQLEKELLRNNVSYANLMQGLSFDWREIKKSLSKGEIAIEFIQLPILENNEYSGKIEYAAIILKHDSKYPEIVTLFKEDDFDINNHRYKRTFLKNKYQNIGKLGYDIFLKDIENYLPDIHTIYYSPIGVLNSIPFASLFNGIDFLCDKYSLQRLSSTAELPEFKKGTKKNKKSLVYGGIDYDADEKELLIQANDFRDYDKSRLMASRGIDNNEERSGWSYLVGTLEESENISQKLADNNYDNTLMTGVRGTEESFKSLSGHSPSILHIATHGFFLSDKEDFNSNKFITGLNPYLPPLQVAMNRSGLLLAGANHIWLGEEINDDIEDGILTADEISKMDLSGTDIVILSACETGLGEDAASEGVFGLQRAFKLAGVNTLVMSLWKVPDEETSQLMQSFYDNWLGGMERHEAFRKAQQQIKEEKPNPYYWAGFVMLD